MHRSGVRNALCVLFVLTLPLAAQQKSGKAASAKQPTGNATSDVNADIGTAARKGDTATVQALLKSPGSDINALGLENKTPLMWAALYGHLELVKTLVAAGARVEEADSSGATALVHAGVAMHDDVVAFLRSKGAQQAKMDKLGGAMWILGQPPEVFAYINQRTAGKSKQ